MSAKLFERYGRFLKEDDEDFVIKIETDLKHYISKCGQGATCKSVLLFPPVSSYRRFLIHKTCGLVEDGQSICTFSIGQGHLRRTVVCFRGQILNEKAAFGDSEENDNNWRSQQKTSYSRRMGVEANYTSSIDNKCGGVYRPPALRAKLKVQKSASIDAIPPPGGEHTTPDGISGELTVEANGQTLSNTRNSTVSSRKERERRPDRAVYVPRAKRVPTTVSKQDSCGTKKSSQSGKEAIENWKNKLEKKTGTIVQSPSSHLPEPQPPVHEATTEGDRLVAESNIIITNNKDSEEEEEEKFLECENFVKSNEEVLVIETKMVNSRLSDPSPGDLLNEDKLGEEKKKKEKSTKSFKDEKDLAEEMIKASQEMNRSSRRIMKPTTKDEPVLVIEEVKSTKTPKKTKKPVEKDSGKTSAPVKSKSVDIENDDWDTIYGENGECLDPKLMEELTAAVGKVEIEKPTMDYDLFQTKQDLLKEEEFPHVLEVSNFPAEFKTQDLMMLFNAYKDSGFDIKWVDDTHALVIFTTSKIAAEILTTTVPFVQLKPLAEATAESRAKAKRCASTLQPYKPRPETCAALARRLVTGALGVRMNTKKEVLENERRVLREAKERKLLAAKQRDEIWGDDS